MLAILNCSLKDSRQGLSIDIMGIYSQVTKNIGYLDSYMTYMWLERAWSREQTTDHKP